MVFSSATFQTAVLGPLLAGRRVYQDASSDPEPKHGANENAEHVNCDQYCSPRHGRHFADLNGASLISFGFPSEITPWE